MQFCQHVHFILGRNRPSLMSMMALSIDDGAIYVTRSCNITKLLSPSFIKKCTNLQFIYYVKRFINSKLINETIELTAHVGDSFRCVFPPETKPWHALSTVTILGFNDDSSVKLINDDGEVYSSEHVSYIIADANEKRIRRFVSGYQKRIAAMINEEWP